MVANTYVIYYIYTINLLVHIYWKYFLPFHSVDFSILPFILLIFPLPCRSFLCDIFWLIYLCYYSLCFWWSYPRNQCQNQCHKAFPLCFLLGILQLNIFLSLYFDLITVYGVRGGSSFIPLHVYFQFSQNHPP